MSPSLATGRLLLMGAPGFSGPRFERVAFNYQFNAVRLELPRAVEFRAYTLETAHFGLEWKNALSVAREGEQRLGTLAPAAGNLGAVDEWVWRVLRDQIAETPQLGLNPRLATEHVVYESARARKFATFLQLAAQNPAARSQFLRAAGDLMIQSHFSLDHRWKIRSPEADEWLRQARKIGPERGVYGARLAVSEGGDAQFAVLAECDADFTLNHRI